MPKTSQTTQSYYAAYGIPMPQAAPPQQVPLPSVAPRNWTALALRIAVLVLALGTLVYVTWYGIALMRAPQVRTVPAALDAVVVASDPPQQSASAWRVVYQDTGGYVVSEYATQDAAMDAFLRDGRTGAVLAPLGWVAQGSVSARRGWTYQAGGKP